MNHLKAYLNRARGVPAEGRTSRCNTGISHTCWVGSEMQEIQLNCRHLRAGNCRCRGDVMTETGAGSRSPVPGRGAALAAVRKGSSSCAEPPWKPWDRRSYVPCAWSCSHSPSWSCPAHTTSASNAWRRSCYTKTVTMSTGFSTAPCAGR